MATLSPIPPACACHREINLAIVAKLRAAGVECPIYPSGIRVVAGAQS